MKYEMISKNPLFRGIEQNEIEHLFTCLQAYSKTYQKEEYILRRGNTIQHIGLLLKGSALIIKDDYWGNRTIIKEIAIGELFGEAYACCVGSELEVSVLATQECEVLFLDITHLTTTCSQSCQFHQRIIQNLLTIASHKNLMLTQKMEHITKRTTREKILSYLSTQVLHQGNHTITIPFNRQELADYLSVDRSALSSELSKMQKEGIISYHKNTFELAASQENS